MPGKLSNQEIDVKLKNTKYIRIEAYLNAEVKSKFACKLCGTIKLSTFVCIELDPICSTCNINENNVKIDQFLIENDIKLKRIDNYKAQWELINFKCLKCNNICLIKPKTLLRYSCLICFKNNKNILIDENIKNRNIIRLSNYEQDAIKIKFQCLICNKIWPTKASIILGGSGCIYCCGQASLSNNDVDERLLKFRPTIKRIGDYKNNLIEMEFKCLKCNENFITKPANILYENKSNASNTGNGCQNCSLTKKVTNEIIDQRLIDRNASIIRIGDITNISVMEDIDWKCLICNKIWATSANSVLYCNSGCVKCSKREEITNIIFDERIKYKQLTRITEICNTYEYAKFNCNKCDYNWWALPGNILYHNTGCPMCKQSIGERTIYEILKFNNINFESQYKIYINGGIFNERPKRIDFYLRDYNLFIEYNGMQHYEKSFFNNKEVDFEKQILRDVQIKNYCITNSIQLLEIDCRKYNKYILKENKLSFKQLLEKNILNELSRIKNKNET